MFYILFLILLISHIAPFKSLAVNLESDWRVTRDINCFQIGLRVDLRVYSNPLLTLSTPNADEIYEDQNKRRITKAIDDCKDEINPTEDDLNVLRNDEIPSSESGKCFLGCIGTKLNLLKDGFYQRDSTHHKLSSFFDSQAHKDPSAEQEFIKCENSITGSTQCETGPQLYACLKTINGIAKQDW